ncbi:MAG: FAD-dependent oxidoreductase [Clostridia bacterium]|nr:FAD-dependent oxidoreductase [Clostridia bacterium]
MNSLWKETAELPSFPSLKKDIRTDVLIIGGGMAGILTAFFLQQKGIPYLLVEKGRICSGNTGNTTAKITCQHGLIYHKIFKSEGVEAAKKYLQANQAALKQFRELAQKIDCDYETKDNFVYSTELQKLNDEMEALQRIGYAAQFVRELPLPVPAAGAVKFPDQAQFHPLKFVAEIAKGLHIYENTFVREMVGNTAVTDQARIHADRVVVATHFPFLNKHGSFFLKLYQHRSYVIALKNAADVHGMYVDDEDTGLSFRNQGEYLLLGGGGHRTGKKGGNWAELRGFAKKVFPHSQERYFWAAQDCMSLDQIPYIGQYSKNTPNLYVASGFNKWGMTGSMLSAMLLSDLLLGKRNEFAELFDPSRNIVKPQLFINSFEAVVNLLSLSSKRCPHLGCALKWNAAEHSWDCPCHGSRFSETGEILDNPANGCR